MSHGNQFQSPDGFQRPSTPSFYDQYYQQHQRGGTGPSPRGFPSPMHRQQKSPHLQQQSPYQPQRSPHQQQQSPYYPQRSPHQQQQSPYQPQRSPHQQQQSPYQPQRSPHAQFPMGMRGSPHSNRFQSPNYRGQYSTPYRGGKRGGHSHSSGTPGRQYNPDDVGRLYYKHSMVEDPWVGMEATNAESMR